MNELIRFLKEESAVTTVEIILILIVLISLVVIFKSQIGGLVKTIMDKAVKEGKSV